MKLRLSLLAVFALLVAIPPAFGQAWDPNGGGHTDRPGRLPDIGTGPVSRVVTQTVLRRADGTAIGKVKTGTVTSAQQTYQGLDLRVSGLAPNTEYALVVDGTLVGTAVTNASGFLKMRFLTPSNGRTPPLPENLLPISAARSVAIYQTSNQQLVASGTLAVRGGTK
jgi:hypothetical protein